MQVKGLECAKFDAYQRTQTYICKVKQHSHMKARKIKRGKSQTLCL
jgi:hypothetical protein